MTAAGGFAVRRIYDDDEGGGYRVLVDRLWPRGVTKQDASLDEWAKDVAPSAPLRAWFGHDPARWTEFRRRYFRELAGTDARGELLALADDRPLTLLFAAKDPAHNNAVALRDWLTGPTRRSKKKPRA